jgi:alkyl sulfatase BDS1-like metallo-beta-lactamase superfamily hydrolase
MGSADAIIEKANAELREGRLRLGAAGWNHVVYADPTNMEARNLLADVSGKFGYQSEAGTWRGCT